jgi:hypothetical protein
MGVGKEGRLRTAGHFDLDHEVGQVCLDGAFGYAQLAADLAIVRGVTEQYENLAFSGSERGDGMRVPWS